MTKDTCENVNPVIVGDFVDNGSLVAAPRNGGERPISEAAVEYPRLVGEYVEYGSPAGRLREFTVLLNDNREVVIRGHAIEHRPGDTDTDDPGSYGVVMHSGGRDVLVALFRACEVRGIFDGAVRVSRTSA